MFVLEGVSCLLWKVGGYLQTIEASHAYSPSSVGVLLEPEITDVVQAQFEKRIAPTDDSGEIGARIPVGFTDVTPMRVKEGFGYQINLYRDRGLSPEPPAQKSDTLPLDHQVTFTGSKKTKHGIKVSSNAQTFIVSSLHFLNSMRESRTRNSLVTPPPSSTSCVSTLQYTVVVRVNLSSCLSFCRLETFHPCSLFIVSCRGTNANDDVLPLDRWCLIGADEGRYVSRAMREFANPDLRRRTRNKLDDRDIGMAEVDPETLLEWLNMGQGDERDMQLIALEQLCMLLLMSDNVDRCFESFLSVRFFTGQAFVATVVLTT
uniref:E3 ubiquitin-protein ligase n=1 Tax=Timema genevievae TaxID=629358 RepID=A0A7R9PI28_TIMGE|nr:unnamed protein product [Timema genevievae]